jgi:hypothetical protein
MFLQHRLDYQLLVEVALEVALEGQKGEGLYLALDLMKGKYRYMFTTEQIGSNSDKI